MRSAQDFVLPTDPMLKDLDFAEFAQQLFNNTEALSHFKVGVHWPGFMSLPTPYVHQAQAFSRSQGPGFVGVWDFCKSGGALLHVFLQLCVAYELFLTREMQNITRLGVGWTSANYDVYGNQQRRL